MLCVPRDNDPVPTSSLCVPLAALTALVSCAAPSQPGVPEQVRVRDACVVIKSPEDLTKVLDRWYAAGRWPVDPTPLRDPGLKASLGDLVYDVGEQAVR